MSSSCSGWYGSLLLVSVCCWCFFLVLVCSRSLRWMVFLVVIVVCVWCCKVRVICCIIVSFLVVMIMWCGVWSLLKGCRFCCWCIELVGWCGVDSCLWLFVVLWFGGGGRLFGVCL